MDATTKEVDEVFDYRGFWNSEGHCRIRVYRPSYLPDLAVVIASELLSNRGTSITNTVENLIRLIRDRYNLNLFSTVWVEHYPPDNLIKYYTYSKVFLASGKPIWKTTTKQEIEQLIKGNLDEEKQ